MPDFTYPRRNEMFKGHYESRCYSRGGWRFYTVTSDNKFVHRCAYPGGENQRSMDRETHEFFGENKDPATGETTRYIYNPETGKLKITVRDRDKKKIGERVMEAPTKASDLPFPRDVIRGGSPSGAR